MNGCRALTADEIQKIVAYTKETPRTHLAIMLPLTFGLRVTECCGLRFRDVRGGYLVVKSLKGSSNATMPIPPYIQQIIERLELYYYSIGYSTLPDDMPIFHRLDIQHGRTVAIPLSRQWYHRLIKRLFRNVGLTGGKLAATSLRKSYAIELYSRLNNDLVGLQQYMRHKVIASTVYYMDSTRTLDLIDDLPWVMNQSFQDDEED